MKKLAISKETLTTLNDAQTQEVAGGLFKTPAISQGGTCAGCPNLTEISCNYTCACASRQISGCY